MIKTLPLLPSLPLVLLWLAPSSAACAAESRSPAEAGSPANASMQPERQQEADWVDRRWNNTVVGPFLTSTLSLPGAKIARGLSVRVGDGEGGTMCYDTATASWRAAWLGGRFRFDSARYGLLRPPTIEGTLVAQAPSAKAGGIQYRGLHLQGRRVVLESMLGEVRLLESPWLLTNDGTAIFLRTLEISPSKQAVELPLLAISGPAKIESVDGGLNTVAKSGTNTIGLRVMAPGGRVATHDSVLTLELPATATTQLVQIALSVIQPNDGEVFPRLTSVPPATGLTSLLAPGPARWLPESVTRGQRGLDLDILAIDTLTVPYDNPWRALMFLTGVDFTPDGAAYVCSVHGDVWKVTGIDDSLRELRWHRYATGLFQPLGLKVRDGEVFVLGRDQITRLHDRNQDGEADYYESFCGQIETSIGGHDYVACLEKDDRGNFYYVDPRGIHRVSPDGRQRETVGTGWRNPNGMGVSPDGSVLTVAPQQGEWTPSSQISQVRRGGYYGYGGPKISETRPLGYDAPLCWIPHAVDNSSGSQVWVPAGQWGVFGGQMLHLLWGRCGLMLVLRDEVRGISQGAVVPLPGRLLSGPNRGSFNPRDQHLYIAGSTGWQTAAAKDGALQRVRYTGRPVLLPTAWHAHSNGVSLTFAEKLEPAAAEDPGSYSLHQWNYRYASAYGSKDWSALNPKQEGRDEVAVKRARLLADGKTVFLEASLIPVMQMEIKYSLNTAAGKAFRNQLWLTLNALDR